jgi:hypothetical protein
MATDNKSQVARVYIWKGQGIEVSLGDGIVLHPNYEGDYVSICVKL